MSINWEPTGRSVYFLEPHQDDGALFMAQVAAHHVLAGREVHVVLLSNGSTSNVLQKLNGQLHTGPWWGGFHQPEHEGYDPFPDTPGGRAMFGLARTREWSASWTALGVPPERQHFGSAGIASSALLPNVVSVSWVREVMHYWALAEANDGREMPGFYGMHWEDPNSDHAASGLAMRQMRTENPVTWADVRWLTKPEEAEAAGATPYPVPAALSGEEKLMQKRAAYPYRAWAPEPGGAGMYATGMHSVSAYFQSGPLTGAPNHIVRMP